LHRLVVGLAHRGRERADEIGMSSGPKPFSPNDRRLAPSGDADDVSVLDRGGQVSGDLDLESSARRSLASACARAGIRFQIATRSRPGRTLWWARISGFAMAPAPTISRFRASGRERWRDPSAESAAVFQTVIAAPSNTASGRPSSWSNSTNTPCTEGKGGLRLGLWKKPVTVLRPMP
jgi:hypothetical protein